MTENIASPTQTDDPIWSCPDLVGLDVVSVGEETLCDGDDTDLMSDVDAADEAWAMFTFPADYQENPIFLKVWFPEMQICSVILWIENSTKKSADENLNLREMEQKGSCD